jgi:hypothetical protein
MSISKGAAGVIAVVPLLFITGLTALVSWVPAHAQDPTVCPQTALLSYVRAGAVCQSLDRDEICLGNGSVTATFQGTDPLTFETPGDLIPAGFTESVTVSTASLDQPDYAVAQMLFRANTTDPEQRAVTVLAFGNATVSNGVPSTLEIPVVARGTLNIRDLPEQQSEILEQVFVRESVLAHGRNQDGTWLRVTIPGSLALGWVAADVGAVDGNVFDLPVVEDDTPFLRPFQVMSVTTGDTALCGEGIAANGVLLQTPNPDDEISLTINDTPLRVAGTLYIEAGGSETRYTVLEGFLILPGDVIAPTGTEITAQMDAPIALMSAERLLALPTNNLPKRVQIPEPPTDAEIEQRILAYNAVVPTPIPPTAVPDNACGYVISRNNTPLQAGPGSFYESINTLNAGFELTIVLQTQDADGGTWYQLRNSNWVAAAAVTQSGECDPIPITDFVEAPRTNTVQMETCEASNGPLREGQIVTFEFRPPAADNYPEMAAALRTDPGRLRVENQNLRVRATDPILIASEPERWARIYSATWEAQAGTYRVESARLSYILICELTVRAG